MFQSCQKGVLGAYRKGLHGLLVITTRGPDTRGLTPIFPLSGHIYMCSVMTNVAVITAPTDDYRPAAAAESIFF